MFYIKSTLDNYYIAKDFLSMTSKKEERAIFETKESAKCYIEGTNVFGKLKTVKIRKTMNSCQTCVHRANSIQNVKNWIERGSIGLPFDPVPKAECKEHELYGSEDKEYFNCEDYKEK